jgi:hypothetical protein
MTLIEGGSERKRLVSSIMPSKRQGILFRGAMLGR